MAEHLELRLQVTSHDDARQATVAIDREHARRDAVYLDRLVLTATAHARILVEHACGIGDTDLE